jgi:hypothetical protein
MKRIGVDLSPKQHSRIRNGHYVRVKKGSGILLVNAGNYDALSKTFLRGKSKDISLTAEEIMANRKFISPEAHNERMAASRGGGSYSMNGGTRKQQDAQQQAYWGGDIIGGMNKNELTNLILNKNKVISGLEKEVFGGFIQTKQDRQEGREQQKYGKFGSGFQNNIGGTKVRTMAGLTSGYLYDAGQGNLDANIGNMMLNLKSIKSRQGNGITGGMVETRPHTQVPTVMGRGSMLVGRPQALQSQPLSANYQFRNMFPPAFKKHME